jgi:hypothetical protein
MDPFSLSLSLSLTQEHRITQSWSEPAPAPDEVEGGGRAVAVLVVAHREKGLLHVGLCVVRVGRREVRQYLRVRGTPPVLGAQDTRCIGTSLSLSLSLSLLARGPRVPV